MSINVAAQPGRGRICRITLNTTGRPTVMPAQIVPTLRDSDDLYSVDGSIVKAVRKVDVVVPHAGRDYATGAIISVQSPQVARAFAVALLRAADLLDMEVAVGALDTLDPTAETFASLMKDDDDPQADVPAPVAVV